jgi:hypothetical protein
MASSTSRGYRYPQSPDPVRPYLDIKNLADDVNGDIDALTDAWTTYTPTFGAGGGSPSIGSGGTITGRYRKLGRTVHASGLIQFGTSPNSGTGGWTISLPFAVASVNNVRHIGSLVMRNDDGGGTGWYVGSCMAAAGATSLLLFGGFQGQQIAGGAPFTIAVNDVIWWSLTYEAAS